MKHTINWSLFHASVRLQWNQPCEMSRETGVVSRSTLMNAWRGESIGLLPFLAICKATGHNPMKFLVTEDVTESEQVDDGLIGKESPTSTTPQ